MSEWVNSPKIPSSHFRKLLQERIEQADLRHKLTTEETKCLNKLKVIADRLKHLENMQNQQ